MSLFDFPALRDITPLSIVVRIFLALAVGGILGMERGRRNRPAGFRTYMLVCLGAALVMMTNQFVFQQYNTSDPVRMGAQVVSGIGFLGAGTIVMTGKSQIRGITTAAGLWAAACCGLAIGIGFYEGAIAGGLTIFAVMAIMQRLDSVIRSRSRTMEIYLELDPDVTFGSFIGHARAEGIEVFDVQIQKSKMLKDSATCAILMASGKTKMNHTDILQKLGDAPGVQFIEELHHG